MKKRADNIWGVEPNGVKTVELDDGCKVELMRMWNGVEEWIGYTTFTKDGRIFSDGWARTEEEAIADAKDDFNQLFGFHHRQYNRTLSKSKSMKKNAGIDVPMLMDVMDEISMASDDLWRNADAAQVAFVTRVYDKLNEAMEIIADAIVEYDNHITGKKSNRKAMKKKAEMAVYEMVSYLEQMGHQNGSDEWELGPVQVQDNFGGTEEVYAKIEEIGDMKYKVRYYYDKEKEYRGQMNYWQDDVASIRECARSVLQIIAEHLGYDYF